MMTGKAQVVRRLLSAALGQGANAERRRQAIASRYDLSSSAADVLDPPVVVCRAIGTTVVPKERSRTRSR